MYIFAPVPGIAVTAAKVPARIATNTILAIQRIDQPGGLYDYWSGSSSPGGGGPGLSPISTNPPPSIEATGASLAQLGKSGGPARASKQGSRPRRYCKPGYRWNGTRCVPKY